jgi:hypothetical protein
MQDQRHNVINDAMNFLNLLFSTGQVGEPSNLATEFGALHRENKDDTYEISFHKLTLNDKALKFIATDNVEHHSAKSFIDLMLIHSKTNINALKNIDALNHIISNLKSIFKQMLFVKDIEARCIEGRNTALKQDITSVKVPHFRFSIHERSNMNVISFSLSGTRAETSILALSLPEQVNQLTPYTIDDEVNMKTIDELKSKLEEKDKIIHELQQRIRLLEEVRK